MASLQIRDLHFSKRLDKKALAATYGGTYDWISTFRRGSPFNPYNIIIGKMQIFNVVLIDPVFNTLNQNQFINIDASEAVDSDINIRVDQGQTGSNRS